MHLKKPGIKPTPHFSFEKSTKKKKWNKKDTGTVNYKRTATEFEGLEKKRLYWTVWVNSTGYL